MLPSLFQTDPTELYQVIAYKPLIEEAGVAGLEIDDTVVSH